MPSLRRSVSSSAVRASPYPSALSVAGHIAIATRQRRAVSGSETGGRRVLGEIEWWRVLDGQRHQEDLDLEADHDHAQFNDADEISTLSVHLRTGLNAEVTVADASLDTAVLVSMDQGVSEVESREQSSSLATPFSALSISAMAPSTPPRSHTHFEDSREGSPESFFEPSPTSSPLVTEFGDSVDIFIRTGSPLEELGLSWSTTQMRPSSLSIARSVSFGGFCKPLSSEDGYVPDVAFV